MRRSILISLIALSFATPGLAEGITVGGRVLGPEGAPLPDATVDLLANPSPYARAQLPPGTEPQPVASGRTNRDGRFRVLAPRAGLWRLRVEAPGLVPMVTSLSPLVEPVELPDVELVADAGMTVRVSDSGGTPLADAVVGLRTDVRPQRLMGSRWRFDAPSARTDGDGRARLSRAAGKSVTLSVYAPGWVHHERKKLLSNNAAVELSRGVPVTVEVRDANDRPAAGVCLFTSSISTPIGVTDDDGRVTLYLAADGEPIPVSLAAEDGRIAKARVSRTTPDAEQAQVVVLPDRVQVVGRLIDADTRRPLPRALVWDASVPIDAATTDDAGGFVLSGAPGASLLVTAAATGYLPQRSFEHRLDGSRRPGPTLALRPAAAVEGRVVDGEGLPVSGAEAKIAIKTFDRRSFRGMNRVDLPRSLTDDNGHFRLAPVDPEGSYRVEAIAEGFSPAEQSVGDLAPRQTKTGIELALGPGHGVFGVVVDVDGQPIAGASVELQPSPGEGMQALIAMFNAREYPAATDEHGRFRIDHMPTGKFDIEARRSGYARRSLPSVELAEDERALDLGEIVLQPGERLQGFVSDANGQPIEGVDVFVADDESSTRGLRRRMATQGEPETVSGPGGWFAVDGLAAGRKYTIRLNARGYVQETVNGVEAPSPEPLQVSLASACEISGNVIDGDGRPVEDADVALWRIPNLAMGRRFSGGFRAGADRTDEEGRFRFEDLEPGKLRVTASAAGFSESKLEGLEVVAGEVLEEIELELGPGAIVEGEVAAPDGRPAIGAVVRVVTEEARAFQQGGARADASGIYRLVGLAPGEVSIEAVHGDYPRVVRDVELREGVNALDLEFEGGQEVSGRVVSTAGDAVHDASVRLSQAGRPWGGPSARSRGDGSFVVTGVLDGDYTVSVGADGYAEYEDEQHISVAGQSVAGLELVLDSGASIAGEIIGLEADRLVDVTVRLQGGAGFGRFSGSGADAEGNFRIDHVGPGEYFVVASLDSSGRQAREQVKVEPGVPEVRVDLQFEPGLTLSGRALHGDTPIGGARVSVTGLEINANGWTQTDHEGRFVIEGLETGRYRVSLRDWDTGLSHEETVELEASREITLRVPTAKIGGRIVDAADRQALTGVTVTLERDNQSTAGRMMSFTAVSDLDGAFEIRNLADGEWRLSASKKGYAAVSRTVSVGLGSGGQSLQLTMDATEGMTLEARMYSGAVPAEVRVAVLDASGAAILSGAYSTGEGGRVRLSSVPPGSWELLVQASGSAVAGMQAQAPGTSLAVTLPPATSLRVTVPALAGTNTTATVLMQDEAGRRYRSLGWTGQPRSEWRMVGGAVEVGGLPPGVWSVVVTAGDGRTWRGSSATAAGSMSELRLE